MPIEFSYHILSKELCRYFLEMASLADWRVVSKAAAASAKTPPLVVEFPEELGW